MIVIDAFKLKTVLSYLIGSLGSQSSQSGQRPGATLSTRAPTLIPSVQSDVKLLMGTPGILFCIQPSSLCFGVFSSTWPEKIKW